MELVVGGGRRWAVVSVTQPASTSSAAYGGAIINSRKCGGAVSSPIILPTINMCNNGGVTNLSRLAWRL